VIKTTRIFGTLLALLFVGTLPFVGTVARSAETESQTFSVPQTWNVPAATLPPGSYTIRVVDHTGDRSIVSIENASGSVHSTFVAVPDAKLAAPSSGPLMWGNNYVRGWRFPGAPTVMEFAYPKTVAVSLARQEKVPVLAVDPDSEGMKPVPNALASKQDMEVVSLWLLSANRVVADSGEAEIQAVRYNPGTNAPRPKHVAAVTDKRLPKTASHAPLLALLGCLCFAAALSLRIAPRMLAVK
jgi:hypothetical protein